MKLLDVAIEVVPYCPLRCPSCPVGRDEITREGGYITPENLKCYLGIIAAHRQPTRIELYQFSDPLLHPQLPELVDISKRYAPVQISTTGNTIRCNLEHLVATSPEIVVSTSGWSQEVYAQTHVGGNVKNFRYFLSELVHLKASNVVVLFHRYAHNLHEEAAVRKFTKALGFRFNVSWATQLGIESIMEGKETAPHYIIPIKDRLRIAQASGPSPCYVRLNQLTVLANGDVIGCGLMSKHRVIGNLWRDSMSSLMAAKATMPECGPCLACHAYEIACPHSVAVDKACAEAVGDSPRFWLERVIKRRWVNKLRSKCEPC